jgi:serine/threonine protein kinase
MRELKVLQMLKHDNIVEYKEAFKRKGDLFLVFEYVDKNLLELLQEHPKGLDPSVIKKVIYQLCKAIKYLHEMSIVHRDIKPENLLVDSNLKLKLCDFGFARTIKKNNEKLTDYVATRWYRSPELLITSGYYGPEIDYWAIGCIMGELADGDPLFPGDNELDQLVVIQKVLGRLPDHLQELYYNNPNFKGKKLPDVSKPETLERRYLGKLSKQAISFMKSLLNPDPKQRLKGDAVFSHSYFENYHDPFPTNKLTAVINNSNMESLNLNKNQSNSQLDKKTKIVQPIISNTTNINIINYNNFDNKNSPTTATATVNNPNNIIPPVNINSGILANEEKISLNTTKFGTFDGKKTFTNTNFINPTSKMSSSTTGNMVLTSYNFNQNLKDNILSMYSSTAFDKNFKTFYKGDPYNFEIDTNFIKEKGKKQKKENDNNLLVMRNNLDIIGEEKTQKHVLNPVKKQIKLGDNTGNAVNILPVGNVNNDKSSPKAKKKTNIYPLKNLNTMYGSGDDTYKLLQTKYANLKIYNNPTNMTNKNYVQPIFQLPSINSKNFSLKKLIK